MVSFSRGFFLSRIFALLTYLFACFGLHCLLFSSFFSSADFSHSLSLIAVLSFWTSKLWQYKRIHTHKCTQTHTHARHQNGYSRSQQQKGMWTVLFCSFLPLPFECVLIFRSLSFTQFDAVQYSNAAQLAYSFAHIFTALKKLALTHRPISIRLASFSASVSHVVVSLTPSGQDLVPLDRTRSYEWLYVLVRLRVCVRISLVCYVYATCEMVLYGRYRGWV